MKTLIARFPVFTACVFLTLLPAMPHSSQAEEIAKPSSEEVEKFVKQKLPSYLRFKTIEIKGPEQDKKTLKYSTKVTVTVDEHLYKDVTEEVPEIANAHSTSVEPPQILKKIHPAGEIIEIAADADYLYIHDEWKPNNVDDHGSIESLGLPQKSFKFGNVVFGTPEAKRLINQYLKEAETRPQNKKREKTIRLHEASPRTPEAKSSEASKTDDKVPVTASFSANAAPEVKDRTGEKSEFKEFEKRFYATEKSSDTHLKTAESNIQKVLRTTKKEGELKNYEQKYKDDILALAENYSNASREVHFASDATNFRVKTMCEEFAEAYKSFSNGEYDQARLLLERARKKKDELRDLLSK